MIIYICFIIESHAHYLFCFISFSQLRKYFSFSHLGKIFFKTVNKNVGAGINTLMSISDGLGPSIFCRKMEKARPMREEMDGRVVYFPPDSAVLPLTLYFSTVLLPICTLTWCVNNYVSCLERTEIRKMKVQFQNFWELHWTSFRIIVQLISIDGTDDI